MRSKTDVGQEIRHLKNLLVVLAVGLPALGLAYYLLDRKDQQQRQDTVNRAEAQRIEREDAYRKLATRLGTVTLSPKDTSVRSLNELLRSEGREVTESTVDAVSYSWLDGLVRASYHRPTFTMDRPAAHFALFVGDVILDSSASSKGEPTLRPDMLDLSFEGVKPGVTGAVLKTQLSKRGASKENSWEMRNGWHVFWNSIADDTDLPIYEIRFSNPLYHTQQLPLLH